MLSCHGLKRETESLKSLKADTSYVNTQLATKPNATDVSNALNQKAEKTYVDTTFATTTNVASSLALKADLSYVNTQLATKPNATDVSNALNLKADKTYVDTTFATTTNVTSALNLKADKTYVDSTFATTTNVTTALNLKADKTYVDTNFATNNNVAAALNLKADKTYVDTTFATTTNVTAALNLKADKTYVDNGFLPATGGNYQVTLSKLTTPVAVVDHLTLIGATTDNLPTQVLPQNKTQTYASFQPNGSYDDWLYLRQIGPTNDYHMAFDFHDDQFDGKISFRNVASAETDDPVRTFFKATATRGFYNPIAAVERVSPTVNYNFDGFSGITKLYCYGSAQNPIVLPVREQGVEIEIINFASAVSVFSEALGTQAYIKLANGTFAISVTVNASHCGKFVCQGNYWWFYRYSISI